MNKAILPGFSAHEQLKMLRDKPGLEIDVLDNASQINPKMDRIWVIHFRLGGRRYYFNVGIAKDGRACSTHGVFICQRDDEEKIRRSENQRAIAFKKQIFDRVIAAAAPVAA